MMSSCAFVGAALAVLLLATHAGFGCASNTIDVLWQFLREDGQFASGTTLEDDLGPITIEAGAVLRFHWEPYGFAHSLVKVDTESEFLNCNLASGTTLVARNTRGEYNATLSAGTHYFAGGVGSNCNTGLRVAVTVLPPGETVPPTVMTTTPFPAVESDLAKVVPVDWTYNVPKSLVEATEDDIVQFRWSGSVASSIRRVSQQAYEECNFANPLEIVADAATSGVVNVTNLDVGMHYFISAEITHCSSAQMSVAVNIVPRLVRQWVTLWPSENSQDTEERVSVTITGFDEAERVWVSPSSAVNRVLAGSGDEIALTVPANEARTFEVVTRDVGTPIAVRLTTTAEEFSPDRVRLRVREDDLPEDETRESKTFQCSRPEGGDNSGVFAVTCIVPSETVEVPTATNQTEERDCQCYRQLLSHHPSQRVLACSKEGCFATVDDGTAGWSSVPAIRSLIGTALDGRLMATASSDNTTLASINGGLTWHAVDASAVPPVTTAAVEFADPLFEGDGSEPLDRHVQTSSSGAVDWGITRKGVLVNTNGEWEFRALWSCTCDGSCGLKCDQPSW